MQTTPIKSLESHKEASARTRKIFLFLNICSILLLISLFNYRWSWRRHEANYSDINYKTYEYNDRALDKAEMVYSWLNEIKKDSIDEFRKLKYVISTLNDKMSLGKEADLKYSPEYLKVAPQFPVTDESDMLFLQIPLIGIKIYVQDVPFLGGFAISILLTWYFYARRREKGAVYKLYNFAINENKSDREISKEVYETIMDNNMFNTVPNVDKDKRIIFKPFSDIVISLLIACPVIFIGIYQGYDIVENLYAGDASQKYLSLSKGNKLVGSEIDYYKRNFNIPISEVIPNVKTLEYTDIIFFDNPHEARATNRYIRTSMLISFLFFIYACIQVYNIRIIREDEGKLIREIENAAFPVEDKTSDTPNAPSTEV